LAYICFLSPEKETAEKHPFFEPWEDSDLILVVENERFHVHRQILSIHSPVFKAMLNSQFKEATAEEIPLPGKKANEILDFLKQLYLKERDGLTSECENYKACMHVKKQVCKKRSTVPSEDVISSFNDSL